jgi:hypothetical protein
VHLHKVLDEGTLADACFATDEDKTTIACCGIHLSFA